MPIRTALWAATDPPRAFVSSTLESESQLEDMIVASPNLLSNEWMLIGRQVRTAFGGQLDLLAIAPDASLVLIELKKDKTPRDVVTQAIEYASWVEQLESDEIVQIYRKFKCGNADLAVDFENFFDTSLDEEALNQSHQIVIAAASVDPGTERIIAYLNERDISVNMLCFQVFAHGDLKVIGRTWLLDPATVQSMDATSTKADREPWNGEYYCSFGQDPSRDWRDAVEFGFISGGGGSWYSKTLHLLKEGDRVWVNIPRVGYVGVGIVTGHAIPINEFTVEIEGQGEQSITNLAKRAHYNQANADDPDKCEYFVPVRWLETRPVEDAFQEIGLFGNQNTICRPRTPKWRHTISRLKQVFPRHEP